MIERITGCGKPCNYLEYKFHGGKHPSSFPGDHCIFSFYALTRYTWIWREEVFYPSSTMVAEVGGILSLFIGVSFMTIWDGAAWIRDHIEFVKAVSVKCQRGERKIWWKSFSNLPPYFLKLLHSSDVSLVFSEALVEHTFTHDIVILFTLNIGWSHVDSFI